MRLAGIGHIMNIIREIDLGAIRDEADQRFDVLVIGQPEAAGPFAELLGTTPGRHGIHPWITVHHLPVEAGSEPRLVPDRFTLAIVVTDDIDTPLSAAEALRRLEGAGVATVVAVLSDDALTRVGADAPRAGELARAIMPSQPTDADVRALLAPVLLDVLPTERGLRMAFARRMPALRTPFIRAIVDDVARANATYSVTTGLAEQIPFLNIPLNAADMFVLTKNQLLMAYKIALAAGKRGRPAELMGEIISVLGGGLLFREVARKLVGLVPVIGLLPKVAVSYAGTKVIGTIVERWATEGHRIQIDELSTLYNEAMSGGRELAKSLAGRIEGDNFLADAGRTILGEGGEEGEGGDDVVADGGGGESSGRRDVSAPDTLASSAKPADHAAPTNGFAKLPTSESDDADVGHSSEDDEAEGAGPA